MSDILLERHNAVLLIRMQRPSGRNTISGTLLREVAEAFEYAAADDEIGAVVTTGAGSTFCVGGDIDLVPNAFEMPTNQILNDFTFADYGQPHLSPRQMHLETLGIGRFIERIRALEKPTVAALNGATAGGGASLALHHDFRIAADHIRMTMAYLNIGLAPEHGSSAILPRLVGWRNARDLLMRPEPIDARRALEIGLVDYLAPADELVARALTLAAELAERPRIAMQLTKRLLNHSLTAELHEQLQSEYQAALLVGDLPETRAAMRATRDRIGHRAQPNLTSPTVPAAGEK